MPCPVSLKFFFYLLLFLFRERRISPAVFPSIAPAIPRDECRMAACPDPVIHQLCQCLVSGTFEHALTEFLIGLLPFFRSAPAPVCYIMAKAAITPLSAILKVSVREEAASIARKIMEHFSGRDTARKEGPTPEIALRMCIYFS